MPKRHEAALRIKPLYQKGAQSLNDTEALEVKGIYPKWEDLIGTAAEVDYKFTHNDVLYKVIQAHTFQSNWAPGTGTESLYVVVDETHAGTIDNPIPYNGNMALENGKYYSQDGVVYYCNRDTINPVYSPLKDLVGLFVEVANG
jgi:hypothetical protein